MKHMIKLPLGLNIFPFIFQNKKRKKINIVQNYVFLHFIYNIIYLYNNILLNISIFQTNLVNESYIYIYILHLRFLYTATFTMYTFRVRFA